ncbi:hypothetical protein [Phenylobacterium sp.]|jgi:hypothetical protein|uniref:hypothetical protein n=1 Tax=Phenylobacterium sp. TaxID=1871053 RepID=UPI002E3245B8|nr:hypothetical protein [Phenylobacterium sp.]HEX2558877.1 hypothetical protein [Phenylobacterium sp.]
MKLHYLMAGIAASALMAGAAQAQLGAGTDAGATPNQSSPADATQSQTGVPSVDATRPTGADAGRTNLPGGTVDPGDDNAASSSAGTTASGSATMGASSGATASTDMSTGAASATSAGMNASTGGNVQLITNGPVPDTAENRSKYGQPMSRAGKRTAPAGN